MMKFKKAQLAFAIATLCLGSHALASPSSIEKSYTEDVRVSIESESSVVVNKRVDVEKTLALVGGIHIEGEVGDVGAAAMAVVDDKQISHDNRARMVDSQNTARVNRNSLQDASGNVGLNVAAGANNAQSNALALAVVDLGQVFRGSADAELFVNQDAAQNNVVNRRSDNLAVARRGFMNRSVGNLQANLAAGANNLQKNDLVIAIAGQGALAEATASMLQQAGNNEVLNRRSSNTARLGNHSLRRVSGNVGVNIAAGGSNAQSNSLILAGGGF